MARFAGYSNHVGQYVEANTGIGGAPWKVWEEYFDENDILRPEKVGAGLVDGHIKEGGIELLVMTYVRQGTPTEDAEIIAAINGTPAERQAVIDAELALRIDAYRTGR